ncbi:MAG: glycosyltransferase family 2 protein [Proteobacteria bacterium]|nr:MAG: glycosyltransferase family 2 protein [Pseudomonadota bacterium]
MKILAIILTYNEEIHLERCLSRLKNIVTDIWVVDSFSTDRTEEIAYKYDARFMQNKFVNHAAQFKWALAQVPPDIDWIMRVDADEYLSHQYVDDISRCLHKLSPEIKGVYCRKYRVFQGKLIRFGAVNGVTLGIWKRGCAEMETRWMDEHLKLLSGESVVFRGGLIDHNLQPLSWWTAKHNGYSSREVIEILNQQYKFDISRDNQKISIKSQASIKRFIKEQIYNKLPCGVRPFMYFCFRYFFALGFLDGFAGFSFHFLQGFWYRFLVDVKLKEVERIMNENSLDVVVAIKKVLDVDVAQKNT